MQTNFQYIFGILTLVFFSACTGTTEINAYIFDEDTGLPIDSVFIAIETDEFVKKDLATIIDTLTIDERLAHIEEYGNYEGWQEGNGNYMFRIDQLVSNKRGYFRIFWEEDPPAYQLKMEKIGYEVLKINKDYITKDTLKFYLRGYSE